MSLLKCYVCYGQGERCGTCGEIEQDCMCGRDGYDPIQCDECDGDGYYEE